LESDAAAIERASDARARRALGWSALAALRRFAAADDAAARGACDAPDNPMTSARCDDGARPILASLDVGLAADARAARSAPASAALVRGGALRPLAALLADSTSAPEIVGEALAVLHDLAAARETIDAIARSDAGADDAAREVGRIEADRGRGGEGSGDADAPRLARFPHPSSLLPLVLARCREGPSHIRAAAARTLARLAGAPPLHAPLLLAGGLPLIEAALASWDEHLCNDEGVFLCAEKRAAVCDLLRAAASAAAVLGSGALPPAARSDTSGRGGRAAAAALDAPPNFLQRLCTLVLAGSKLLGGDGEAGEGGESGARERDGSCAGASIDLEAWRAALLALAQALRAPACAQWAARNEHLLRWLVELAEGRAALPRGCRGAREGWVRVAAATALANAASALRGAVAPLLAAGGAELSVSLLNEAEVADSAPAAARTLTETSSPPGPPP
jgi:hypothetical protein